MPNTKTVYSLRADRDYIAKVQAASLSPKPFGLKATNGLFGSGEWWQNIETGVIPLIRFSGTITRLLRTGMHNESESFEMLSADGKNFQYDCVAADRKDRKLYQVGSRVELSFVRQELKQPVLTTTGEVRDTHSRSLVEIKIDVA
jgi:hypothetical protein